MPGWVGLAVYVAAYDAVAAARGRRTMTSAFHAAMQHPWGRWAAMAAAGVVVAHLFVPGPGDPVAAIGRLPGVVRTLR
jgi:methyl coenzyme M reductase beta subunit